MTQDKQSQRYSNGRNGQSEPDPEVKMTGKRRQYSQAYKLRILAEADNCQLGEVGALLRREGLYHSTLSKWRQQAVEGKLDGRRAQVEKDDLVYLEGYLVDLQVRDGGRVGHVNTSLSREDTGAGACEVLYVERLVVNGRLYE